MEEIPVFFPPFLGPIKEIRCSLLLLPFSSIPMQAPPLKAMNNNYKCSRCKETGFINRVYYFEESYHILFQYCAPCLDTIFGSPFHNYHTLRSSSLTEKYGKPVEWINSHKGYFDAVETINRYRRLKQENLAKKRKANQINEL